MLEFRYYENDRDRRLFIPWRATREASRIAGQIQATAFEKKLYQKLAEEIMQQQERCSKSLQALFATSQLDLCASKVRIGPRKKSEREEFKESLIQFYGADIPGPYKPPITGWLHDSATGDGYLQLGCYGGSFSSL
jgi:flagellar biosynthesis regulator FlaF